MNADLLEALAQRVADLLAPRLADELAARLSELSDTTAPAATMGHMLLDITQAARAEGVSTRTIERRLSDGELERVRIGGRTFVRSSDLGRIFDPEERT